MDKPQEEVGIAVGSTGTLLALMSKEMEILQARKSSSVSHNHNYLHCKKSPSPNTMYASYGFLGPPASPPLYTSLVSSLWNDLKSLLRSPTSAHHHHALFCQEQLDIHEDSASFCTKTPPSPAPLRILTPSHPSPLTDLSAQYSSPKRAYPHLMRSPSSAEITYPKEKIAAEASPYSTQRPFLSDGFIRKRAHNPHGKGPLPSCSQDRLAAEAADFLHQKSPLQYRSQQSSDPAYRNPKDTDVYPITPTRIDRGSRKGNHGPEKLQEQSLAAIAAAKTYPKGKIMDAKSPDAVQNPTYPKANAMDAVYAMAAGDSPHSKKGKVLQRKDAKLEGARESRSRKLSCSRKREERANNMQDKTYCVQKREERGYMGKCPSVQKREERERLQDEYNSRMQRREERAYCMQDPYCKCRCMQKPMLEEKQTEPCTPTSSPLNTRPSFKPSRSFGGRALPLVNVVDLQCCHTADLSSRRLSFTRLSSF